ncbi:ABC-three component system protein [Burkholderia sp. Ax-1719]|uniref:ABC-three component system protein n=1 Tax=Burkholderia sp. Ax-1719 TaxID=2608334 RepID=UPI001422D237|nr:ABC-three component system protein [Burkholderia sp. Ax-1719]NIE63134.1 hypothetical protein [Burkholderia sp. Ax-1719]
MTNASIIPASAISSWGGFVYQGKVALLHSITLLLDGCFNNKTVSSFELQLDSTDDFAIYVDNKVISAHQVKAKNDIYRSAFVKALNKSSLVDTDCTAETKRFFHIARPIDNDSDHQVTGGGLVTFYTYGTLKHCPLEDIEELTKKKIADYLKKHGLPETNILLEKKYCALSEMISSQVIKIHSRVHAGQREAVAAYTHRISSEQIKSLVEREFRDSEDEEYILLKLKADFAKTLEQYVLVEDSFSEEGIERVQAAFDFIYSLENKALKKVLISLNPHVPEEATSSDHYQNYADVVMHILCKMIFDDIPHYSKASSRYLPTGIRLEKQRASSFKTNLVKQIQKNSQLVNLLFEFENFIAIGNVPDMVVEESRERVTQMDIEDMERFNIVKTIGMRIVSSDVAQEELK